MSMSSVNLPVDNKQSNNAFVNTMSLKDFRQCHKGARFASTTWGDKVKQGVDFAKLDGGYTFVAFSEKCGQLSAEELKKGFLGESDIYVGQNASGYYYFFRNKVVHEVGDIID